MLMLFYDFLKFIHECINILEFPVNRSKPYICYLVDLLEFFHDTFSYNVARNLLSLKTENLCLDLIDHLIDGLYGNRSLMTGCKDTLLDLITVILFTDIVLFYDYHRDGLYLLIGGKPFIAAVTLPSTSDR